MQSHTSLDIADTTWDDAPHPYTLQGGVEDPLPCVPGLGDVPDMTYSPSTSSDSSLEDATSQDSVNYDCGIELPHLDSWFIFQDYLERNNPGILEQAKAHRTDLVKRLSPPAQSKRPSGGRIAPSRPANAGSYSDGDADSDYLPSPALKSRNPPRSRPPTTRSRASASPANSFKKRSVCESGKQGLARNGLAPPEMQAAIRVALENDDIPRNGRCLYCRLFSPRKPDVLRHMKSHLPQVVKCIGVPLEEARHHPVPTTAEPYLYGGVYRIGGCMKTFSRRDALRRHLKNDNVDCISNYTVTPTASEHM